MSATAISVVHKYLRRELFDLAEQLFRAGPNELEAIRTALGKIGVLLQTHAAQEDARLAPLLREANPALAERMARDHHRLEDQFAVLLDQAKVIDPVSGTCQEDLYQLHLDWNRFVANYLLHLDDEERTLFATIKHALPPLAAIAQSAQAQGADGEEFLLRLWAVTTCEERMELEARVRNA